MIGRIEIDEMKYGKDSGWIHLTLEGKDIEPEMRDIVEAIKRYVDEKYAGKGAWNR